MTTSSGTRKRARFVLFVEDCPDVRAVYAPALADAGFIVTEVASVADALAYVEMFEPDAVILDYELPDGDGFQIADALTARGSDASVIAFTAHNGQEVREAADRAGCVAYLVKPCTPARLVTTLETLLEQRASTTRCA